MEISIKITNVNKSFNKKVVFSNLSFIFYKRIYHVIGKNGVGKSTLLKLIAGVDLPDSGKILMHCQEELDSNINESNRIFYVPDDLAVYSFLKGGEFLTWISSIRTGGSDTIKNLIQKFDLEHYLTTSFGEMSLGTKKKFMLISALIGQPDFIILDEPLNGLDRKSQDVLISLIKHKTNQCGIIFTTHYNNHIDILNPIEVLITNCSLVENLGRTITHESIDCGSS